MKGHGPISKMYGSMVDGKAMPEEEMGESPEMEAGEDEGMENMSIDKASNGYSVHVRHAAKGDKMPPHSLPHVFPHGHPVAHHIAAILKHTKGGK